MHMAASAPISTSGWIGAEYTPWNASNELWWIDYDAYRPTIDRELGQLKKQFGFTALRVWLHSMLHSHDATGLKNNVSDFLTLADSHGFGVGLVFFDDCWNTEGANLTKPCIAKKGVHNGCWMTSPQQHERTSVARFEPYVRDIVTTYGRDKRVLWFETFNEPSRHSNYSAALKAAAYGWAKAAAPMQPIAACWDDSNSTDLVDHHQYGLPWGSHNAVFSNPKKGGFITEAGSRWYQHTASDQGSTLTLINWLHQVRAHASDAPPAPCGLPSQPACNYTRLDGYLPAGHDAIPWAMTTADAAADKCSTTPECVAITYEANGDDCSSEAAKCKIYFKSLASGTEGGASSHWVTKYKYGPRPPPFVPGVMLQWEMMVGHSMTRWHWGSKEGTPEPAIPWDAHMFPDGTPVSYTEAAAVRNYTTGRDDFLALATYLDPTSLDAPEVYRTLATGETADIATAAAAPPAGTMYELAVWPESADATLVVSIGGGTDPPSVTLSPSSQTLVVQLGTQTATYDIASHKKPEGGLVIGAWNLLRVALDDEGLRVWFNPQFPDVTGASVAPAGTTPKLMPPRLALRTKSAAPRVPPKLSAKAAGGTVRIDYMSILPASVLVGGNELVEVE